MAIRTTLKQRQSVMKHASHQSQVGTGNFFVFFFEEVSNMVHVYNVQYYTFGTYIYLQNQAM